MTGPWLLRPIQCKTLDRCLRRAGKGLRLLYPYRPVLDTPEPWSTNFRAGAEAAPQNDSSEQETRRKAYVSFVALLKDRPRSADFSRQIVGEHVCTAQKPPMPLRCPRSPADGPNTSQAANTQHPLPITAPGGGTPRGERGKHDPGSQVAALQKSRAGCSLPDWVNAYV
jgi:hypothetical protein